MSFNLKTTNNFDQEAKSLAKKYPSLKNDLRQLSQSLQQNPTKGQPLGHNCYKIRMAITSKNKGKSGGARIITHIYVSEGVVFLLSIYDKSELENISDKQLKALLRQLE